MSALVDHSYYSDDQANVSFNDSDNDLQTTVNLSDLFHGKRSIKALEQRQYNPIQEFESDKDKDEHYDKEKILQ